MVGIWTRPIDERTHIGGHIVGKPAVVGIECVGGIPYIAGGILAHGIVRVVPDIGKGREIAYTGDIRPGIESAIGCRYILDGKGIFGFELRAIGEVETGVAPHPRIDERHLAGKGGVNAVADIFHNRAVIHLHGNTPRLIGNIEIDGGIGERIAVKGSIVVDNAIAHRQREVGPLMRSSIEGSPLFADTVLDDAVAYGIACHRPAAKRACYQIDRHRDTTATLDERWLITDRNGIAVDDMKAVEYGIGNFLENNAMVNKHIIAHLTVDDRTILDGIPQ